MLIFANFSPEIFDWSILLTAVNMKAGILVKGSGLFKYRNGFTIS